MLLYFSYRFPISVRNSFRENQQITSEYPLKNIKCTVFLQLPFHNKIYYTSIVSENNANIILFQHVYIFLFLCSFKDFFAQESQPGRNKQSHFHFLCITLLDGTWEGNGEIIVSSRVHTTSSHLTYVWSISQPPLYY